MLASDYRNIVEHLNYRLIGQPRAISQLERSLKIIQAGLRDRDKPLAILFFAGPTGTGKSESPRALAEAIHGDPEALCRVDCNLLTEAHMASSLVGSPPGYIGSGDNDSIFNEKLITGSAGKPGILVLEEIEKAHPTIFDIFLGIFDKAKLNRNNGRGCIDFSNTIIIMTSNVGARDLAKAANSDSVGFSSASAIGDTSQLSGEERRNIVFKEMKKVFRPEFINRLDDTVIFRWLSREDVVKIAEKFLCELADKLMQYPHELCTDDSVAEFLVDKGFDLANGARPLKRAVRKYVEEPLAEMLADSMPFPACTIMGTHYAGDDKLTFTCYQWDAPELNIPTQRRAIEAAQYAEESEAADLDNNEELEPAE